MVDLATIRCYRVQDADGRGPWRPGFSHRWIDPDAPAGRLTESLLDLMSVSALRALPRTYHYGCACHSPADLAEWLTTTECRRLEAFGFHPVRLMADVVLVESAWQIFFGRLRPLNEGATRLSWTKVTHATRSEV